MNIENVLEKALLVNPEESLTHVVSKMVKERKYEAYVFDKVLRGVVSLDDIVKRKMSNPEKIKISYFTKPITPFPLETPVQNLINYVLANEYKSLPFEKGGEIYTLPKSKLLNFVDENIFESKKADDIMQENVFASVKSTLSNVISLMRKTHFNRIPIVNEKGQCVGIVDSMSVASSLFDRERVKLGERGGEKIKLGEIGIEKFLRKDFFTVEPETSLKEIVKRFVNEPYLVAVVEADGEFKGIITPKDIFRLISKTYERSNIQVSGIEIEDEFIKRKLNEMIENSVNKLSKILKITHVSIHIKSRNESGKRARYTIIGSFKTEKGSFHAKNEDWEITKAMKIFLKKIEKEIHKSVERERGY
jgi:CBS domain-containing protein